MAAPRRALLLAAAAVALSLAPVSAWPQAEAPAAGPRVTSVRPGSLVGAAATLTLEGGGFDPTEWVPEVRSAEGRVVAAGTVSERSGTRIVATFPLAGLSPGSYTVRVRGPRGAASNGVALTLVGQVTVTPRAGRPGTVFTYAGRGFTARMGVVSHLQGPTAVAFQSRRIPTTAEGTFEQQIDSAEFPPGTYSVWAVDDYTSTAVPAATFQVEGAGPGAAPRPD